MSGGPGRGSEVEVGPATPGGGGRDRLLGPALSTKCDWY